MKIETYPIDVWVLKPSMKPARITLIRSQYSHDWKQWHSVQSGKGYHEDSCFPTKQDALDHGWSMVKAQEADLSLRRERLDKRCEMLRKEAT